MNRTGTEKLLRYARQNVWQNPRLGRTIRLCKRRLERGKNPYSTPSKERWAETMWR
jgi:hypothetical protein